MNSNEKLDSAEPRTTFEWNELAQSHVLGAFYWFHWATQILGGVLAARYGTKLIFGLSNFLASVSCLLVPIAAYWHINCLIALRVIQGIIAVFSLSLLRSVVNRR